MSTSSTPSPAAASPGRRERRRQETLDHLADTAWALFQAHGFEAVTMEAIATTADVAKGTLYKHFPVKEALLRHRFHRELSDGLPTLLAELATLPTVAERLDRFFQHSADWAVAHRDFFLPYVRFRFSEILAPQAPPGVSQRSGLDRLFTGFIHAGQAQGEFRRDLDPAVLGQYLHCLHLTAMMRWLGSSDLDLRTEFKQMLDLFLNGLGARP